MTKRQLGALASVIISSGVVFLDGSVVTLALPAMAKSLHTGFTAQQWIVDGYMLSLSALLLVGGTLGDIFGRKRTYMIGLIGFGICSLLCAVMVSAGALVAARILQGVFGALLIPGALAIINTNFAPAERGAAFGRWTAWSAAATAGGPLLGGYLIDAFSWRWIFLLNIPLIIVSVFLAVPGIVESRDMRARRVDVRGAALAMLALAGITYGLIEGPPEHWPLVTVMSIVAGLILSIAFLYDQAKSGEPMLDLKLFRSRNFSGTNLVTFVMYGALSGFFFALIIHLQTVLHYSSLAAGLSTAPVTICLLALSSRAGAWSAKIGPRWFMTAGPLLCGLGVSLLWNLSAHASYLTGVLPGVLLFGLGLATTVAPLTTTVMASVEEVHSGIASAVNNAISRVAGLIIVALLGLLGVTHVYNFTIVLCAALLFAAGIISALIIRNPRVKPAR